jgi:hypothetical protein
VLGLERDPILPKFLSSLFGKGPQVVFSNAEASEHLLMHDCLIQLPVVILSWARNEAHLSWCQVVCGCSQDQFKTENPTVLGEEPVAVGNDVVPGWY